MTIRRADPGGFDVASTTTLLLNGGFNNDNSLVGITNAAPAGRSNTRAYSTSVSNSFVGWWFTVGWQETIFSFAYYNPNATFANNIRICNCQDGATTQVDCRTDATGHLFFTRNGTTIGSASTQVLNIVGWYIIEFRVKVDNLVGLAELRVKDPNGVTSTWLSFSGDTQQTANASANRFYVISRNSGGTQYWKDICILDTGTGTYRDYLGDVSVTVLYAIGADGTYQQWAPNTGTQVSCVQDGINHTGTFPDGDTTIISDTVAGDISAFQMSQLSPAGAIYGLLHVSYARTTSTGTISQVLIQNGLVVETGSTITLTTSYLFYLDIIELNPTGSLAWTALGVNTTHPGVQIQAASASARDSQELLLAIISNTVIETSSQPRITIMT